MSKKVAIILMLAISALLILLIININQDFSLTSLSISSSNSQQIPNSHAWTKAICNKDNFCQDYLIECQGQKPVKLTPLTGATVQFDNTWQDPRPLEQRERLCY